MPQLQWLGTMPAKKSYVGEALEKGIGAYWDIRGKREERALELEKISFDKKKSAADLVVKALDQATPQQRKEILAEKSDASQLIMDVYGDEALDTLRGVPGGRKADKIAKVRTWISTRKKPSPAIGIPIELGKEEMNIAIAHELADADWKETYPEIATEFNAAYPAKKKEPERWVPPWRRGYRNMSEQELYEKAVAGDAEAIKEAVRRGYPVGGKK